MTQTDLNTIAGIQQFLPGICRVFSIKGPIKYTCRRNTMDDSLWLIGELNGVFASCRLTSTFLLEQQGGWNHQDMVNALVDIVHEIEILLGVRDVSTGMSDYDKAMMAYDAVEKLT